MCSCLVWAVGSVLRRALGLFITIVGLELRLEFSKAVQGFRYDRIGGAPGLWIVMFWRAVFVVPICMKNFTFIS